MCGFTAISSIFSNNYDLERLRESLKLIKHRGPDFQQIWVSSCKKALMALQAHGIGFKAVELDITY